MRDIYTLPVDGGSAGHLTFDVVCTAEGLLNSKTVTNGVAVTRDSGK